EKFLLKSFHVIMGLCNGGFGHFCTYHGYSGQGGMPWPRICNLFHEWDKALCPSSGCCLQRALRETYEGLGGLYKGSLALLWRDCFSSAVFFLTYSAMCDCLTPDGKNRPDSWAVLLSGGCAGVLAWGTATPMDILKSRMQADGEGYRKYSGLMHCAKDSIREEGLRVLFKGIGLNSLRAFPTRVCGLRVRSSPAFPNLLPW
uniref:Solute carrier family 25 member 47 n=1 Tax=Salvator merianae TaxID=96440 RepID=A0A8D0BUF4_SALMN